MALVLPYSEPQLPNAPPIITKYEYGDLERLDHPSGVRYYVSPENGNLLPSVTTILSDTSDKKEIKLWEERVGIEKANKVRKESTDLGNLMHLSLEDFLEGRARKSGANLNLIYKSARRMADTIIQEAFGKIDEVWGIEAKLYFPDLYAGTTDLVGVYEGIPSIMDYKTAKKMRSESQIEDYFCQGSAYALAHNHHYGTDIRQIVIFMVTRDLEFKTFKISADEFEKYSDMWIQKIEQYQTKNYITVG